VTYINHYLKTTTAHLLTSSVLGSNQTKKGEMALNGVMSFVRELTIWSRVLEKLKVAQLVKKFPNFYTT
jgi:hypothetical protein